MQRIIASLHPGDKCGSIRDDGDVKMSEHTIVYYPYCDLGALQRSE
jgi:hypothetical protein